VNLILLSGLLGTFIWLASNGLSRRKQIELFLCFQLAMIFVGWVGFNNFYLIPILRAIFLVIAIKLIMKVSWNRTKVLSLTSTIISFSLLGWVIFAHIKKFFFILALGYDNSSHLAFLYRTWVSGKFEYGLGNTDGYLIPYSNLFNAYPSLQMETWAAINKLAGFNIGSTGELVGSFVLLLFTTIIILALAISSFSRIPNLRTQALTSIAAIIFLVGGTFSSVVWSGFPPTIWGILVSVFVFRFFLLDDVSPIRRFLFICLGLVILLYSYQIFFFPFLVLPAILLVRDRKKLKLGRYGENLAAIIFLISLASIFLLQTIKIKSYTFALGGIQFPSPLLFFGLILFLILLAQSSNTSKKQTFLESLLLYSVLLFGGILIIYGKVSDRGAYYPVKVLYLFLTLMMCFIIYLITNGTQRTSFKLNTSKIGPLALIVILSIDLIQGQTYKFAFGGNSANILREWQLVQNGDYSPFGNKCLDQIFHSANRSTHFGYNETKHLNYVPGKGWQTDLLSRWSNSLEGRIDDLVLELTIPMGSNNKQSEIIRNFKAKYPDVEVLPINLSKTNACSY
jgi:hypothetical protein